MNETVCGAAESAQTRTAGKYRFTVLTPRLFRIEESEDGSFCDEPTQTVVNRRLDDVPFRFGREKSSVTVETDAAKLLFDMKKGRLVSVALSDGRLVTDFSKGNLGGTARTLDNCDGDRKIDSPTGKLAVGDGIVSVSGVALLDDSKGLILKEDGSIAPRGKCRDVYCFCYGYDYTSAVRDFFRLTGFPPLIPRFALGNWWSRYKAYTQEEYLTLMRRFAEEKIPLTVATIDMDWHWTDVTERFGKEARDQYFKASAREAIYLLGMPGWSGYSWNTELFPDPKGFLKTLKDMDLRVTMNLHPHSGCRFFEDAYGDFADFMGVDKSKKEQIFFDITDPKFREGYFRFLHHPHEADGVDFWWIDWQQSERTAVPGLDPLWALNHYHTLDNGRDGKRPLILSRFAGAGSHRYPLGFSGDTFQTWRSLAYQPEFTAKATNIGYTWWSHDVGGHCFGRRDDELYLRWVQYGVFSPINRLHSTANEFMGKEPWKYRSSVRIYATDALRFRRRLIPYLYTMNYRTAALGRALTEPMYYHNPRDERAYSCPNEYWFGSEMIVAPITEPMDKTTNLAGARVYLPKGRWTDVFTGRIYRGNTVLTMYRDEASIPVLAKAGAIIPLDADETSNGCANPSALDVWVYRGGGSFTLYEDDGQTRAYRDGAFAETRFTVSEEGDGLTFRIDAVSGDAGQIPAGREIRIIFRDVTGAGSAALYKDGKRMKDSHTESADGETVLTLRAYSPACAYELRLGGIETKKNLPKKEAVIELFSRLQEDNNSKLVKYTSVVKDGKEKKLPKELRGPMEEIDDLA